MVEKTGREKRLEDLKVEIKRHLADIQGLENNTVLHDTASTTPDPEKQKIGVLTAETQIARLKGYIEAIEDMEKATD